MSMIKHKYRFGNKLAFTAIRLCNLPHKSDLYRKKCIHYNYFDIHQNRMDSQFQFIESSDTLSYRIYRTKKNFCVICFH